MSNLLIVGASLKELKSYISSHDHDYAQILDKNRLIAPINDPKKQFLTDFSSKSALLATVREINQKFPFDGLLLTYESSVVPAALIAEYLNLSGLPLEAAKACTNKFVMRQKFKAVDGNISPDFQVIESEADLVDFASSHKFPLIIKPINLVKSLLVVKVHSQEELLSSYQQILAKSGKVYKRHAPRHQPQFMVEEFMEGSVHSVDAYIDHEGTPHVLDRIVDYQTGYDIGFDDNFHYSRVLPSALSEKTQAQIIEVAKTGCKALGMKSSPAHIEVIVTKDGPKIVEIGARPGGYRERMHRLSNGIDIFGAYLRVAFGQTPDIKTHKNESCAVLELFPKRAGKFKGIKNEVKVRQLSSLVQLNIKSRSGQHVSKSSEGHKMCAMIMLHNSDAEQFQKDLEFINQHVSVETV